MEFGLRTPAGIMHQGTSRLLRGSRTDGRTEIFPDAPDLETSDFVGAVGGGCWQVFGHRREARVEARLPGPRGGVWCGSAGELWSPGCLLKRGAGGGVVAGSGGGGDGLRGGAEVRWWHSSEGRAVEP